MSEPWFDPREDACQWCDSKDELGPHERDLADLWTPEEFHEHVASCLEGLPKGPGREETLDHIAWDVATAPDDYLELFEAEELVPLLSADWEIARELALRALGRLQPATRGVE